MRDSVLESWLGTYDVHNKFSPHFRYHMFLTLHDFFIVEVTPPLFGLVRRYRKPMNETLFLNLGSVPTMIQIRLRVTSLLSPRLSPLCARYDPKEKH
jgi:hypothetical protein